MAIWDLFSKRQKRLAKQGQEDVFQYDDLPKPFRVQVIHIWNDGLGQVKKPFGDMLRHHLPNQWWAEVFDILVREKGVFKLATGNDPVSQCREYLLTAPTEDALDLIELSFAFIPPRARSLNPHELSYMGFRVDQAIDELNTRFREHAIGFEFSNNQLIRVDSKYLHAEVLRPALSLLGNAGAGFRGPLEEFLKAHEHHRKGDDKAAITEALKAFESTMKAICKARGWPYDPAKDTASKLIQIVFDKELIPAYLQTHFGGLRAMLEAGVPTVRNRAAGHGQGPVPLAVPAYLASYVLHATAANIVLLIEAHNTR